MGANGGAQTHTLTEPEMRHQHGFTTGGVSAIFNDDDQGGGGAQAKEHTHAGTTGNPTNLSVSAHQNTQPTIISNWLIKYA
jgi:hypothetical protein